MMEKRQIVTHSKTDSSRVLLNNKVYENISNNSSSAAGESIQDSGGSRRKHVRLESGQAALMPRQCRNVNQKEELMLKTLERNLTRQKQAAIQSQAYSMQKYRQRLAGYERLRMSGAESINGSRSANIGESGLSDPHCGRAASRGKSTYASDFVRRISQSICGRDVNRQREAELSKHWSCTEEDPGVYNTVNNYGDVHSQQVSSASNTGDRNLVKSVLSGSRSCRKSQRLSENPPKKKLRFEGVDKEEEETMLRQPDTLSCSPPDSNLLSVDEGIMRPRAYTDPTSDKAAIKLPEIMIEDCSDPDDKCNNEDGAFSVFASPPRRRANTCPEEFFNRRRKGRPPTPPPTSRKGSPTNKFTFGSGPKSPVSFVHHKLSKVSEDSDSDSPAKSAHRSRQTTSNRRRSLNTVSTLSSQLDEKLSLKDRMPISSLKMEKPKNTNEHIKSDGKASDGSTNTSLSNQEMTDVYPSKECRFSHKISQSLDGKPLEAC